LKKKPTKWREAFKAASLESDKSERKRLCAEARRLMQERLVAIANGGDSREERTMEEALRKLWTLEHGAGPRNRERKRKQSKRKR